MKRIISITVALFTLLSIHAQESTVTFDKADSEQLRSAVKLPADVEQSAVEPAAITVQSAAPLWDEANTAYINGDYGVAIATYESILEAGLFSDKLLYNIGNAYYKDGQLAKAILFYNRAARLEPSNEDIRHNLEIARLKVTDRIDEIPQFFLVSWCAALRNQLSCFWWYVISLVLFALALFSLLRYLLSSTMRGRKVGFYLLVVSLGLFAVAASSAYIESGEIVARTEAIVMSNSLVVKSSPDHSSTDLFVLHAGTQLEILDTLDSWSEIRIADGKKGWVESRRIEQI